MNEVPRIPQETRAGKLERNKHFAITGPEDGVYRAKASLKDGQHTMEVSLVIQVGTMEILELQGAILDSPHRICPSSVEGLQKLVGMRVQPGLLREMQQRVGGYKGCIHMNEIIRECVQLVAAHRNLTEINRMQEEGFTEQEILAWGDSIRSWTCTAVPEPLHKD